MGASRAPGVHLEKLGSTWRYRVALGGTWVHMLALGRTWMHVGTLERHLGASQGAHVPGAEVTASVGCDDVAAGERNRHDGVLVAAQHAELFPEHLARVTSSALPEAVGRGGAPRGGASPCEVTARARRGGGRRRSDLGRRRGGGGGGSEGCRGHLVLAPSLPDTPFNVI